MSRKKNVQQSVHVITLDDLKQSENTGANPDDPAYSHRILAEGDSWFSIGAIPSFNLLFPPLGRGPNCWRGLAERYQTQPVVEMTALVDH
ncbi:MAG: hypothetical protein ABTQ26_15715 [Azonexus sp.]